MQRSHLMLLHGALGAATQLEPLAVLLRDRFDVHTLDFEGHGRSPLRGRPLGMACFAENVLDYLNENGMESTAVFGHSLGGHVALYLARFFPQRVTGVFTLGTKFTWSVEIARRENTFLMPEKILEKVPKFARLLQERHVGAGWKALMEKLREMQLDIGRQNPLPDADIRGISQRVRIGVGDRDKMVGLEESIQIYRLLQQGELQVFPDTPHPLEQVSMERLAAAISDFFR